MQIQSHVRLECERGISLRYQPMSELIGLIERYRKETSLSGRLDLAGAIHCAIHHHLRLFIFGKVHPSAAEDVLSKTLIAIVTNLEKFEGKTEDVFWGWCYRIARNKANDHHRSESADRL